MKVLLIDMSSVRWGGTADVANPRPREVEGACRRQVLAGARTLETVGGPNGAQRSELRRTAPPDDKRCCDRQSFPDMSWISVVGHACMTLTNAPGPSDVVYMVVLPHQYATPICHRRICMTMSPGHPRNFTIIRPGRIPS